MGIVKAVSSQDLKARRSENSRVRHDRHSLHIHLNHDIRLSLPFRSLFTPLQLKVRDVSRAHFL